jgi:hypothetical protein
MRLNHNNLILKGEITRVIFKISEKPNIKQKQITGPNLQLNKC